MKKTILVIILAIMSATPCFAQEVESIEGTIWEVLPIGLQIFPRPGIWIAVDLEFGFYDGTVYQNKIPIENSSYEERQRFIVFSTANSPLSTQAIGDVVEPLYLGILQPNGMGIVVVGNIAIFPPGLFIKMGLLIKTEGFFAPGMDPIVME